MSAEAAPQPQPNPAEQLKPADFPEPTFKERPLLSVDLPQQDALPDYPTQHTFEISKLGREGRDRLEPAEVRKAEVVGSPVTDQLNTAASVESLYQGPSKAERVGKIATKAANVYGGAIDRSVEAGTSAIDNFAKRAQESRIKKEARKDERATKKGLKRLNKELRKDFVKRYKAERRAETPEQRAARKQRAKEDVARVKAERKADRTLNRVERAEKVTDFVERKKESTKRVARVGAQALKAASIATVKAPGRATDALVDAGDRGIDRFAKYAQDSAAKKAEKKSKRNLTKAQLHELAAAKYQARIEDDEKAA